MNGHWSYGRLATTQCGKQSAEEVSMFECGFQAKNMLVVFRLDLNENLLQGKIINLLSSGLI
jgi:hypothetical protein